jgi:hypothetical protein
MFPGRQGIGGKQRRVRYFALVPVRSGVRVKKGSVRYSAGFRFAPSQM